MRNLDKELKRTLVALGILLAVPSHNAFGAEESSPWRTDVFAAGADGYKHFRIPGIVVSPEGTVLAYCEARLAGGDWAEIDIALRRSLDGGKSWEPLQVLENGAAYAGQPRNDAARRKESQSQVVTCNNPVMIVDRKRDSIHLLYCIEYGRCWYRRSLDDGVTFTKPVDITNTFDEFRSTYNWKVIATGPGHGMQLENGRLVVPVWLSTGEGGGGHRPSCVSVVYRDDHGDTWSAGEIVVNHPDLINPSETAAEQLSDGRVMLNIRNENPQHRRAVSMSKDGATGWTTPVFDEQLYEPVCMASLLRVPAMSNARDDVFLFCNPTGDTPRTQNSESPMMKRENLTVRLSYDRGRSWPVRRTIDAGASGYSDLAIAADGDILCLYERGGKRDAFDPGALTCVKFKLEWLLKNKTSSR